MDELEVLETRNRKIAQDVHLFVSSLLHETKANLRSRIYMNSKCDEIKIIPVEFDTHYLILKLDDTLNATVLSHSLPENEKYFKPIGTIETHSATFFSLLEQMEDFYAQMDTIDILTYVVDPAEITTKDSYRVIRLENRVYMKIKVDPLEPSSLTTTFFGPTKHVERYRKIYSEKIDEWNLNDDIYRNFLKIFNLISFPQKLHFENNNMAEYCSICYSYRLSNQIPIVSCDNEKCSLTFHTVCLKEWFTTLRDTKIFLNMTSGRCPSCKEKLSTAFSDLFGE